MHEEIKEIIEEVEENIEEVNQEAFDLFCRRELKDKIIDKRKAKARFKQTKKSLNETTLQSLKTKFEQGHDPSYYGSIKSSFIKEVLDRRAQ